MLRLTPSAIATFLDFGFPEKEKENMAAEEK